MTNSPQEPGSQPTPDDADPAVHGSIPPAGAREAPVDVAPTNSDTSTGSAGSTGSTGSTAGAVGAEGTGTGTRDGAGPTAGPTAPTPAGGYPPPPHPGQPAPGYGYGQPGPGYPPPQPTPPRGGKRDGALLLGVIGLVVGVGIGAIGVAVATGGGDDSKSPTTRTALTATPSAAAGASGNPEPREEGTYSMSSVTDACSLIDTSLVNKWSSTPEGGPVHRETQPWQLTCDAGFSTPSKISEFETNDADIRFEAEFTEGEAPPSYDNWKHHDTKTTGSGLASGEVTGIGAQGYWHSETGTTLQTRLTYIVAVQDGNVSVRVRIMLARADGEPPVTWEELDSVARAEARMALDGLKKK